VLKAKKQLFAERLAKVIENYRALNEGEKIDGLELADDLCDDLERPTDLVHSLESMVRNVMWMRGKSEAEARNQQKEKTNASSVATQKG
jgi:hypothetical protein